MPCIGASRGVASETSRSASRWNAAYHRLRQQQGYRGDPYPVVVRESPEWTRKRWGRAVRELEDAPLLRLGRALGQNPARWDRAADIPHATGRLPARGSFPTAPSGLGAELCAWSARRPGVTERRAARGTNAEDGPGLVAEHNYRKGTADFHLTPALRHVECTVR
jgi:hypothetical protein